MVCVQYFYKEWWWYVCSTSIRSGGGVVKSSLTCDLQPALTLPAAVLVDDLAGVHTAVCPQRRPDGHLKRAAVHLLDQVAWAGLHRDSVSQPASGTGHQGQVM